MTLKSARARSQASTIPPSTVSLSKTVIAQLSHSPRLAAETALYAFHRPPRRPTTPKETSLLSTATTATLEIGNVPITYYVFNPSSTAFLRGNILLSHGYTTSTAFFTPVISNLLSHGYRVISPDHMAHGVSGGDYGDIEIFAQTITQLGRMFSPLSGIVAWSVGGTAVVKALAEEYNSEIMAQPHIECEKLVFLSLPAQMESVLADFLAKSGIARGLIAQGQKGQVSELNRIMRDLIRERGVLTPQDMRTTFSKSEWQKWNARTARRGQKQLRCLVISDEDDKVAPVQDAEWLAEVTNAKLVKTKGYKHVGIVKGEEVVKEIAAFMMNDDERGPGRRVTKL